MRRLIALLALASTRLMGASAEGGVGAIEGISEPIKQAAMVSALPEEAPASLFSARLGDGPDSDAELFVSGSWSASVLGSLDLQAPSGSSLRFSSVQPLLFTQAPDLSLSFLLFKKIFVEAHVAEDISKATYAVGYRGGKDQALKEFRVGNQGISFPALPYLSFGEGSYRSFGAAATIASDGFTGKAMLRYDQADLVVKRFVGNSEVTETTIAPNAFIAGKYFLTRSVPATGLVLLVQSVSGTISASDGLSYRRLDQGEYSYSAATGLVSLTAAASTRVLAFYPTSGQDADARNNVDVPGLGSCDLLSVPAPTPPTGSLDPRLQMLNRYPSTAIPTNAEAFVRNTASGKADNSFEVRVDPAGFIEVARVGSGIPTSSDQAARDAYRQPFADPLFGDMAWIYTDDFANPAKGGIAPVFSRSIVLRSFTASQGISIGKDVVAGSVLVTRDGVPDFGFTIDADTGTLILGSPAGSTEEIVVSYMQESAEKRSGSIAAALGGFWDLSESWKTWAAIGASWSVPGSGFAADSRTNPGSINLTAGEKDRGEKFNHQAAFAARYSRDDATGRYRIEGMESSVGFATSFRPQDEASGYASTEREEDSLAGVFPKTLGSIHSDGSTQKALEIRASSSAVGDASFFKVVSTPPYASFKTFSFFAKIPAGVSVDISIDDGSAARSIFLSIPAQSLAAGAGSWKRYLLRYGAGDLKVYAESSEGGADELAGSASSIPGPLSTGSRILITARGLTTSNSLWMDELLLEDSVGRFAALFQGSLGYQDQELRIGSISAPILSGIAVSADAQAAASETAYTSLGASIATKLLFAELALKGRFLAQPGSAPTYRAGHSVALPSFDFPLKTKDEFEFDPATGAFSRRDTLSIDVGRIAALTLGQGSSWAPDASLFDSGLLSQTWEGKILVGPSIATIGLTAQNRARPADAPRPGGGGRDYGRAWIGAFAYAIPAFESSSDSREATATLSIKAGTSEFLSASLGEMTEPGGLGGGDRRDAAALKLSAPFKAWGISFEPYYSRSWKDKRSGDSGSIVADATSAIGDFGSLPMLYTSIPIVDLASPSVAADFENESKISSGPLPEASFSPELGISLSREYGSYWYDLVLPSALTFSYQRNLARAADTLTDSGIWSTSAKYASINLFGSMGNYPTGLRFDSDEYLSTLQARLAVPSDGSRPSIDLQYRSLATLYAGIADRLDADGKLSVARQASSQNWAATLSLSLSRRITRHLIVDLYRLLAKPPAPKSDASPEIPKKTGSLASRYLADLVGREPNMRSTLTFKGGLSGQQSDAAKYATGWACSEVYEAKLTVPERLTFKIDAELDEGRDAGTQAFAIGLRLGLNVVISF